MNLTQIEFAKKIKLSQSTWGMIEIGKRNLNDRHVKMICDEFNINQEWLLQGIGNMFKETSKDILSKLSKYYKLDEKSQKIIESFIEMERGERNTLITLIEKLLK